MKPTLINTDGKFWFLDGLLHRENGPAIEWNNGRKQWYQHGKLHRIGGPAVIYPDGTKKWFEHDKHIKTVVPT